MYSPGTLVKTQTIGFPSHRGVKAFSGCGERGLFYSWGARASDRGGFSCCGARALGTWVSVVAAPGLWSTGSVVVVAWI